MAVYAENRRITTDINKLEILASVIYLAKRRSTTEEANTLLKNQVVRFPPKSTRHHEYS